MTTSTGDLDHRPLPPAYEVADLYPRSLVLAEAPAVVPLTEDTGAFPQPDSPTHPHSPTLSQPLQEPPYLGNGSCQHHRDSTALEMEPPEEDDLHTLEAEDKDAETDGATDSYLPLLTSNSASSACRDSEHPAANLAAVDSFDSADQQSVSHFVNDERSVPARKDFSAVTDGSPERRDSGTSMESNKACAASAAALPPHGPSKPRQQSPPLHANKPVARALKSVGEGGSGHCPSRHHHSHLSESASVPKTLGHLREDECADLLPAKCRSEEKLGGRRTRSSTQDSQTGSVMEEATKASTASSGPAYSYQNCDIILKDPRNEVKYFWIDGEVLAVPKAGAKFKKATFLARKQTLARKVCSCVAVVFVLGAIIAVVVFITLRPSS